MKTFKKMETEDGYMTLKIKNRFESRKKSKGLLTGAKRLTLHRGACRSGGQGDPWLPARLRPGQLDSWQQPWPATAGPELCPGCS